MNALGVRDGYRLWAPAYAAETAVSALEDGLVGAMTPSLSGLRLLDAGCGTGRRLADCGAAEATGVDLCREMLEAGLGVGAVAPGVQTLVADICDLPFADMRFDIAWCRLAIGHIADCAAAYAGGACGCR